MTARPVPIPDVSTASYALMTTAPLDHEDDFPMPSEALLRRYGSSAQALARLRERPHQLLITCQAPTKDIAEAVRDARIHALGLAATHDGVVVELLPPRILELAPEQVSLAQAQQWYVLDYDDLDTGLLRTDGLSQFGLPEVTVVDVDRETHAMVDAVVAGLAHRLIVEWPENDPVGPATVTLRDIAFGLGDPEAVTTPKDRAIDLVISYDPGPHRLIVELLQNPAEVLFA
ncbi:MAG: hypothetical protein ACJ71Z_03795 [Aeromicrobium sp.]